MPDMKVGDTCFFYVDFDNPTPDITITKDGIELINYNLGGSTHQGSERNILSNVASLTLSEFDEGFFNYLLEVFFEDCSNILLSGKPSSPLLTRTIRKKGYVEISTIPVWPLHNVFSANKLDSLRRLYYGTTPYLPRANKNYNQLNNGVMRDERINLEGAGKLIKNLKPDTLYAKMASVLANAPFETYFYSPDTCFFIFQHNASASVSLQCLHDKLGREIRWTKCNQSLPRIYQDSNPDYSSIGTSLLKEWNVDYLKYLMKRLDTIQADTIRTIVVRGLIRPDTIVFDAFDTSALIWPNDARTEAFYRNCFISQREDSKTINTETLISKIINWIKLRLIKIWEWLTS